MLQEFDFQTLHCILVDICLFDKCCHFSKGILFGIRDSAPLLKPVTIYFLFVVYKFFININKHSEVQFILGKRDTEPPSLPPPPSGIYSIDC